MNNYGHIFARFFTNIKKLASNINQSIFLRKINKKEDAFLDTLFFIGCKAGKVMVINNFRGNKLIS